MTDHQPELLPNQTATISLEGQAKREEYRQRLAEYLKDPQFRAVEGFPIGTDEDILALSDPPYYTACPNPFLLEIIVEWQQEREEIRKKLGIGDGDYQREPFAADVSEGKNDPIYNAHSYHTKVPHKAIMRYILHYTDPGDIVFDGFCGTGMTGVAAQLCGDKRAVEELGYRVDSEGVVWEGNKAISRLGARKAVLNDLSPAATFIAYNYNTPVDVATFGRKAQRILREVEQECGWMYDTWHPNAESPNRMKGKINYTVWSDVFLCPNCGAEMVFLDEVVDKEAGSIREDWNCAGCATLLAKSPKKDSGALKAERAWETRFDRELKQTIRQAKQVPVWINYSVGKKRHNKKLDTFDLELIHKIEESDIPYTIPTNKIPKGDKTSDPFNVGITHTHHFYTRRNLWVLAAFWSQLDKKMKWIATMFLSRNLTKTNRFIINEYNPNGRINGPLTGTWYIPSEQVEQSAIILFQEKILEVGWYINENLITTESTTRIQLNDNVIDYVFVDPPFGANYMYSELNFLWESWLRIITNNKLEAIQNTTQGKGLPEYQTLMTECFRKFNQGLKPGGWMTVEFHNSHNAVWNALQEALQRAGFVVADVRTLDKVHAGIKAAFIVSLAKQDLIISAYKPNGNLEERFKLKAGTEYGAWEFVRYHLGKLPVVNQSNGNVIVNAERQAYLLFDRMVAFHIQRGVLVPISSPEFYDGLEQRFTRRDGMYFLPDQVAEYDRAMLDFGKPTQLPLFMTDEKTAITWLRQQLDPAYGGEPQTRGELTNKFNQTMHRARHETALELIEILEQNFLQDETGKWYVPDHNKASDLERVRQRSLLKEFNEYATSASRLRQFRTEAVRVGFADCFKRQDYNTLIKIAERLPEDVLRKDPDLLMYYDSALLRKR